MKHNLRIAKVFLLLLVTVVFSLTAKGQERTVSGKVTSDSGSELPGVTVLVKGSTTGTVTNIEGDYSLDVAWENSTLVFSFIGYTAQEVPTNGRSVINITLDEDPQSLE